jgi:chorismate synthase
LNTFGRLFRVTTFGESHGPVIGCVVDGCPAGLDVDLDFIQSELDRRRPGQSTLVSPRKESDTVQVLSGVFRGQTLGTPIAMVIPNADFREADYSHLEHVYRPGHADYTWQAKYGVRDHRGGGRSSARETAARVAAGAVAKLWLLRQGVQVHAWVSQVGHVALQEVYPNIDLSAIETNEVRCPHASTAAAMADLIREVRKAGDTIGGAVSAVVRGCPPGWGEPVFDKLHADLGKAMLSINAAKGFEYGSGFEAVRMRGSAHNDAFFTDEQGQVRTRSNHAGGILGGISNGMDIPFRVAFKPVATIVPMQSTIDAAGDPATVQGKGRHDPCVVPRAVPIVEAMAALVLADFGLRHRA